MRRRQAAGGLWQHCPTTCAGVLCVSCSLQAVPKHYKLLSPAVCSVSSKNLMCTECVCNTHSSLVDDHFSHDGNIQEEPLIFINWKYLCIDRRVEVMGNSRLHEHLC